MCDVSGGVRLRPTRLWGSSRAYERTGVGAEGVRVQGVVWADLLQHAEAVLARPSAVGCFL